MSSSVNLDECEVATALHMANLATTIGLLEFLELSFGKVLLARPFESLRPCLVTEPVADDCDNILGC
jgi:hypothetical protein